MLPGQPIWKVQLQSSSLSILWRPCHNCNRVFYDEELLAPDPTPKLQNHPLSAVRDWKSMHIISITNITVKLFYLTMRSVPKIIYHRMIDVEGSSRGLIWGTMPAFSWRDWWKSLVKIASVRAEIWTHGLMNTKQECQILDHDGRYSLLK
jgi:hypothetical protein